MFPRHPNKMHVFSVVTKADPFVWSFGRFLLKGVWLEQVPRKYDRSTSLPLFRCINLPFHGDEGWFRRNCSICLSSRDADIGAAGPPFHQCQWQRNCEFRRFGQKGYVRSHKRFNFYCQRFGVDMDHTNFLSLIFGDRYVRQRSGNCDCHRWSERPKAHLSSWSLHRWLLVSVSESLRCFSNGWTKNFW